MISSNLPKQAETDSADKVKKFFNTYFEQGVNFTANEIDAVTGFFEKNGFDTSAALAVAGVLLDSAKKDNIKPFELLDSLKQLDGVQLSSVVAEILNYNRPAISTLGFRDSNVVKTEEQRNIIIPQKIVEAYVDPGYVDPGYVR